MKRKLFDKVLSFANSLAGDYYTKDQKRSDIKGERSVKQKKRGKRDQAISSPEDDVTSYGAGI